MLWGKRLGQVSMLPNFDREWRDDDPNRARSLAAAMLPVFAQQPARPRSARLRCSRTIA